MGLSCANCRFYQNPNEYGGQCFRRPPTPAFQVAFDGSGGSMYENLRPWVTPSEWCGDHEMAAKITTTLATGETK